MPGYDQPVCGHEPASGAPGFRLADGMLLGAARRSSWLAGTWNRRTG